jgi:serine/threonine protein kinase
MGSCESSKATVGGLAPLAIHETLSISGRQIMPTTGETIGPYMLGVGLGEGGFGAVYEATHQETGQRVAIKFLHGTKQLLPEVQNRFVREVALLKTLDHENIVRHFEAGLHEGSIYCAMELVECGSLKEVLQAREILPWREAAEVALQLCRALEHAHQKGCIHRDLKPANLYLSEDGFVKLGDLGLARDLNKKRLTAQGQTVGTWRYMAPEQITGEENIDGRLDLYATGCMLFEMIAGRVPFDGPNFVTIFDQHLEALPARLDVVTGTCPKPLADLVEHLLHKLPEMRPENATEVAQRLEKLLAEEAAEESVAWSDDESTVLASGIRRHRLNLTQRLRSGPSAGVVKPLWRALAIAAGVVALVIVAVLALKSGM